MDATDVILCGLVWAQFREYQAGLQLVRAIESADPELQMLAEVMLEQAGLCSGDLVRDAIATDNHKKLETLLLSFRPSERVEANARFWWLPLASA